MSACRAVTGGVCWGPLVRVRQQKPGARQGRYHSIRGIFMSRNGPFGRNLCDVSGAGRTGDGRADAPVVCAHAKNSLSENSSRLVRGRNLCPGCVCGPGGLPCSGQLYEAFRPVPGCFGLHFCRANWGMRNVGYLYLLKVCFLRTARRDRHGTFA